MPFGAAGSEFGVPAHLHLVQRHFHPQHTLLARNLLQHCDVSIHGILLIMTRLIQFAILLAIIIPFGWVVSAAEVTVCEGSSCTIVSGNKARVMTPEEFRIRSLDIQRDLLLKVDCSLSSDKLSCEHFTALLKTMFR